MNLTNPPSYAYAVGMLTREQMQNTLTERLFWHTAERDDSKVAHHLFCHKEMDTAYTLDEATLFDFFFHYLREIDVFPLLENLDPVVALNSAPGFTPLEIMPRSVSSPAIAEILKG